MGDDALKIAIVAGEASGDRQGAALIEMVRQRVAPRPVEAWGIGGDLMRRAGVELRFDCSPWSTIGIAAIAANIPFLLYFIVEMKRLLVKRRPDVLVLIDSGGFNVPLARWAKRRGICPVFYYFPPGSWRRRPKPRGKNDLAQITDRIVTPFPWSAEHLKQSGADAHFVGHPLLDLVKPTLEAEDFLGRFGMDPHRPLVALLPGSRKLEVAHILPALIGAAGEIACRIPGVQFVLALASTVSREQVEEIIRAEQKRGGRAEGLQFFIQQASGRLAQIAQTTLAPMARQLATNEGLTIPALVGEEDVAVKDRPSTSVYAPLVICEGLTYDAIARSDLIITKSGTSTLEAAILRKPMIILYRGSKLMEMEWNLRKRFLNIAHIGLPNILAEERIFPELIQEEATPEAISELAVGILLQPERLLNLKKRVVDLVRTNLGEPGGIARVADLLLETAARKN
jgi:lipid-A-disaccharide synthase